MSSPVPTLSALDSDPTLSSEAAPETGGFAIGFAVLASFMGLVAVVAVVVAFWKAVQYSRWRRAYLEQLIARSAAAKTAVLTPAQLNALPVFVWVSEDHWWSQVQHLVERPGLADSGGGVGGESGATVTVSRTGSAGVGVVSVHDEEEVKFLPEDGVDTVAVAGKGSLLSRLDISGITSADTGATSSRAVSSKKLPRGGKDRNVVDQEAAKYLPDDDAHGRFVTDSILPRLDTRTADADATAVKDAFLDGLPSPEVDVGGAFGMVEFTRGSEATLGRTSTASPNGTTTYAASTAVTPQATPTPIHRAQSATTFQPQPQPLSLRRNVSLNRLATPPPRPSSANMRLLDVPSVSRTHTDGEGDVSPVSPASAFTDAGAVSPSNVPLLSGIAVPLPISVAGKKGSVGSVATSWLGGAGGGGGGGGG
ncbi:hypothetical protein M427DRAFT_310336, partial [Gonapodya prolifera JEL478]